MIMMLRSQNSAGTFIWPHYKSGQLDAAHMDKNALNVFVPNGNLPGGDWCCTINSESGGAVINSLESLARLITALEIAYEVAKTNKDMPITEHQAKGGDHE